MSISDVVSIPLNYKHKILVGLDHDKFLNRLVELGHDYLEGNKIYAHLFDTIPEDRVLTDMKNYYDILKQFPNTTRIASKAIYIGNFDKKDWKSIIERYFNAWFGVNRYEIVEWVE
jgi:hypothetical protein